MHNKYLKYETKKRTMALNIWGYTLSWDELYQASPSNLQKLPTYTYSIEKYAVSTNNVLSIAYAKTCEKGYFSKITFHAK